MAEVIQIKGRNRYSSTAQTSISISDQHGRHPAIMEIEGGYIENRGNTFVVAAKHPTATDEEGDASYVVLIEGAGLNWTGMMGSRQTFTGALFSAQYVEDHEATNRIVANGGDYLDFIPPTKRWTPGLYTIEVRYIGGPEED